MFFLPLPPSEVASCRNAIAHTHTHTRKKNTKHCTGLLEAPSLGKTYSVRQTTTNEEGTGAILKEREWRLNTDTPTWPRTAFLICGTHYTGLVFSSFLLLKLLTLPLSGKPLVKRKIDDQSASLGQMLQLRDSLCHTLSSLPPLPLSLKHLSGSAKPTEKEGARGSWQVRNFSWR